MSRVQTYRRVVRIALDGRLRRVGAFKSPKLLLIEPS